MKPEKIITIVWWTVAGLVFVIGLAAFALSYTALADVARSNGLDGWMSYVWPILLDVALVVFGLALVVMYLMREDVRWYWFLTAVFTVATIGFNLAHSVNAVSIPLYFVSVPLKPVVHIVAPVALFLSFHSLMEMMKLALSRHAIIDSVSDIKAKMSELMSEFESKKTALDAEFGDYEAEIQTKRKALDTALEKHRAEIETRKGTLAEQIETLQGEVDDKQRQLSDIQADIDRQRDAARQAIGDIFMIYQVDTDGALMDIDLRQAGPELRQQLLIKMALAGRDRDTVRDIYPDIFDKTVKTFDRDVSNCNGQLSSAWG